MKTQLLFDVLPRTRVRRVMMHVCDAGAAESGAHIVNFVCGKCGHDAGWWEVDSVTEGKRGMPCPKCNPAEQSIYRSESDQP